MVDCFHHIPALEILRIWREFEAWWLEQGISTVSVPRQKSGERGRIGKMDIPGWVVVTFDHISCVLTHFADSNFVTVCGRLGQELRGVPMGDALSGATLRLFKWWRERTCSRDETDFVLRYPNTRMQLLRLRQTNVLVLDVSFRDDVRNFAVWSRDAGLSCDDVNSWCERRLRRRPPVHRPVCPCILRSSPLRDSDRRSEIGSFCCARKDDVAPLSHEAHRIL